MQAKKNPAIASIQSSGTRFTRSLFKPRYLKVVPTQHFTQGRTHELKGLFVITPLRRLPNLIQSWIKRGESMERLHRAIGEAIEFESDFYFPIDADDRDEYLKALSEATGYELTTDWAPEGHRDKPNATEYSQEWLDRIHSDYGEFFEGYYGRK